MPQLGTTTHPLKGTILLNDDTTCVAYDTYARCIEISEQNAPSGWKELLSPFLMTAIAITALALLAWLTFYLVKTNEVAVIERFGKFERMAKAGLNVKIPPVDRVADRLSLRVMQLDETVTTITQDKVSVKLNISVQYQVDASRDARGDETGLYLAAYSLTDVEGQISSYVFDAVRSTVPSKTLDEVFAEKDHIAQAVNQHLSATMVAYGHLIVRTLVTGVTPDGEVERAMNQINAAERLKEAAKSEAEAYRIRIVGEAEGDRDAKELSGQGVARQRRAIAEGLAQQHRTLHEAGVTNADGVLLMNQYLDTMQQMAKEGDLTTVFLPGGADGMGQLGEQLRTSILTANAGLGNQGSAQRPEKRRNEQPLDDEEQQLPDPSLQSL